MTFDTNGHAQETKGCIPPIRILVIDDNAENRYMLQTLLTSQGYPVTTAKNGIEALEALRAGEYDLIVSDILMPGMDGFRLIRESKTDPRLQNIPFIFYTATYTEKRDAEFGLSLGAIRYLVKPKDPDVILREVRDVLSEHAAAPRDYQRMPVLDDEAFAREYTLRVGAKLERKVRLLEETEQKYQELFNNVNDAIFIHEITDDGKPGRLIEVNRAACEALGYTREELLGHSMMDLLSERHIPTVNGISRVMNRDGTAFFEAIHTRKDGTEIPVEVRSHVFSFGGRQVAISSARNITERKRAEGRINLANRKLALMTDVTYQDIQNKVTALRGYAELSKEECTTPGSRAFIDKEEQILADIHQLIQNTKEYQRMGLDQARWIPFEETVRMQAPLAIQKPDVSLEMDLRGLQIYADPLLNRVVFFLLDNAITHGKTTTRISVVCRESPAGLVITCEDNGVGITGELKARIFDRVVSGGGHFMMFFIREILDLSGMSIKETGEPGKGAQFEITVPKGLYRFASGENK
ncbi:MAG: response regulator [Methanoregula sp.]|jgi:PAS domain S-box-containing protein